MRVLVVIDMQNDFIDGPLGTPEAQAVVPKVCEKIEEYNLKKDTLIFYTKDTHCVNYFKTQEGQKLPIKHCIKNTYGWEFCNDIEKVRIFLEWTVIHKNTFGSFRLPEEIECYLEHYFEDDEDPEIESIELVGLCTDVCVISNAIILKNKFPEVKIVVDATCCAGTTPENHENALKAMECCQIEVRR
ncbi:isochorismatase family cysteine hydrolase [Anaerovoracaceae bacterium 41-7]